MPYLSSSDRCVVGIILERSPLTERINGGEGPGSVPRTGRRQFNAPVLRPAGRCVVRSHRVCIAETLR